MHKSSRGTFLLPVLLAIGLAVYLVNGTSNVSLPAQEGDPNQVVLPRTGTSASFGGGAASSSAQQGLQVGAFDFITLTPTPVPGQGTVSCDASLQGRCQLCQKQVSCTKNASDPNCPDDGYRCLEQ